MRSLADFKNQFSKSGKIHLNNAGLAPISRPALEKLNHWSQRFYQDGFYSDADYMADVLHSRQSLAKLIHCHAEEIAYFQSTAGAISQIAFGFGLKKDEEVLLWDQEYSSNLYPWQEACKRSGAHLKMLVSRPDLATPVSEIITAASPRTKILAISWVQFQTGARTDIKSLVEECHRRGIFVVVDVMQGLGLHEFDFAAWNVDAVAGGSHKWLVSPVGVGFLALRREHLSRFSPLSIGSATYGSCDDPAALACAPKQDASRFEAGSKQVLEITALGASCDLILEVGVASIEAEILKLSGILRKGLRELDFEIHSPTPEASTSIVNFSSSRYPLEKIKKALAVHPVNFAQRGPGLRLSPHAFNSEDEMNTVLEILGKI